MENQMSIVDVVLLGSLAVLGWIDIKQKMIPVVPVVATGIMLLLYRLWEGNSFEGVAAGLLPGAVLLLLAFCTGESIGSGDGLVVCMVGAGCGLENTVAVLGMALVCVALLAIVLLAAGKAGRKTELPFLPCVFAGYIISLIL